MKNKHQLFFVIILFIFSSYLSILYSQNKTFYYGSNNMFAGSIYIDREYGKYNSSRIIIPTNRNRTGSARAEFYWITRNKEAPSTKFAIVLTSAMNQDLMVIAPNTNGNLSRYYIVIVPKRNTISFNLQRISNTFLPETMFYIERRHMKSIPKEYTNELYVSIQI